MLLRSIIHANMNNKIAQVPAVNCVHKCLSLVMKLVILLYVFLAPRDCTSSCQQVRVRLYSFTRIEHAAENEN